MLSKTEKELFWDRLFGLGCIHCAKPMAYSEKEDMWLCEICDVIVRKEDGGDTLVEFQVREYSDIDLKSFRS